MIPRTIRRSRRLWGAAIVAGSMAFTAGAQAQTTGSAGLGTRAPATGKAKAPGGNQADAPVPDTVGIDGAEAGVNATPATGSPAPPAVPGIASPNLTPGVAPAANANRPSKGTGLPNAAAANDSQPETQKALEAQRAKSASANIVNGKIVDMKNSRLNIRDGESMTGLTIHPKTVIEMNGKPAKIEDLKANTQVQVYRDSKDPTRIQRIVIGANPNAAPSGAVRRNGSVVPSTAGSRGAASRTGAGISAKAGANRANIGDAGGARNNRGDGISAANGLGEDLKTPDRALSTTTSPTIAAEAAGNPAAVNNAVAATNGLLALDLGATLSGSKSGILVGPVTTGSLGANTGFLEGDTIQSVDGTPVASIVDVQNVLVNHVAGDRVPFGVMRDGTPHRLNLTLPRSFDPQALQSLPPASPGPSLASADVRKVAPVDLGWELKNTDVGPLVLQLAGGGAAANGHLEVGDVITSVNGQTVSTPGALYYELNRYSAGTEVSVGILRDGKRTAETVTLPKDFKPEVLDASARGADQPWDLEELARHYRTQQESITAMSAEIRALKEELRALRGQNAPAAATDAGTETPPPPAAQP